MNHDDLARSVVRLVGEVRSGGAELSLDTPLREYGLASLAATRLVLGIEAAHGVRIAVDWLGAGATTRQLIDKLAESVPPSPGADRPDSSPAPSGPDPGGEPFPLTPVQQAYLVGRDPDLGPDPVGCRLYREFALPALDPVRLTAAWRRLVAHHDILRILIDDDGRQRIAPEARADIPVHDLAGAEPDTFARHVREVRERLTDPAPLQAAGWPPYTVEVSLGPDGAGVVHLDIDAMLTDGHGLGVLLDHWWLGYERPDDPLPPSAVPLRDAVLSLHARRSTPVHREDLDHWCDRLAHPAPAAPAAARTRPEPRPG
ncbi:phosphopantetheine-binding protein, partial [Streptomyces sp. SID3212]|uniref:phosphopantetheine-binding protein n=1 Tax=Streptomyces sp. SID3212 TaxID=2690259 RepID=UPI0013C92D86